jgi:hypothetical protein
MAVGVDEAVHVHEAKVLRLVVSRATRGEGLGDEGVDLLAALATQVDQHFHCLTRIADRLGGEFAEFWMRREHDGDRLADDNTGAALAAELRIERVAQCLEKGLRLRQIGDREVEEDLFVHAREDWIRGTPSTNEQDDGGQDSFFSSEHVGQCVTELGGQDRPRLCCIRSSYDFLSVHGIDEKRQHTRLSFGEASRVSCPTRNR